MSSADPQAFSAWLRAQLRAQKMSQRQLAQRSGIDHSTISRLVRGDRMPSLGTAFALARGLRALAEFDDGGAATLSVMAAGDRNPAARVEHALRADEALTDAEVRLLMERYLAIRARRLDRGSEPGSSVIDRHGPGHVSSSPGDLGSIRTFAIAGGRRP